MQINISARHGQLSAATQAKISDKVDKLRRFLDRVTAIEVTVDLEHRESPSVEVKVSAERSEHFVATDTAPNIMAALDRVLHKVEQQLRKHKEKRTGHRATSHKHLEVPADVESEGE